VKFKRETEFQETEIGKIPREWKVVYLSELFEFHRGLSYRKNNLSPTQTSIRFVTINDLKKEGGWKREGESAYLSEEFKDKIEKKHILKVGDLLIAITDMGKGFIIGAPLYINEDIRSQGETLVYSMDLVKLQPKKQVNALFYFYQLSWSKIREIMKSLARGTNVLHLDLNLAQRIKLVEPPLNEQVKIAEILSTVDRAIEVVDAGVARLEGLKKALMRELLTGRIRVREENGKTVFYRETEFQEIEIGRIPKEWKVTRLGDISRIVSGYTFPLEMQGKTDGKYPFIKVNDMNSSYKYIDNAENYVDEIDLPILKARPFPVGTIIFPKIGMAIRLNKFRILKREALFDNNIAGIIVYNEKAHNEYLYYYLQGRIDLMSLAGMTTVPSITKTTLEKLLIPLPPLKEQEKIAKTLSTIDRTIELYYEEKAKFEKLKRGLTDLLLTGRVRVMEE